MRLVTAALPYVNNTPHLGHMISTHLPADVFHRYNIKREIKSFFIGGSDQYGTPVLLESIKKNIDVKKLSNFLHIEHKKIYKKFNILYDNYSKTSSNIHKKNVKNIFCILKKKNLIYEKKEYGFFSKKFKMFLPDSFVFGICSKCKYNKSDLNQCENCGYILQKVTELEKPKSKISDEKLILKSTKQIYFKLSKFEKTIKSWMKIADFNNNVKNETLKWLKNLKDRSITRSISWGIKLFKSKRVFYVWFEALIGYISFLKNIEWNDCDSYQFIGKDNISFHTIFWPAILKSINKKFPKKIIGYNYLLYNNNKFSKSRSYGIFCEDVLKLVEKKVITIDMIRFYLISILPENSDTNFEWKNFCEKINGDLIGNFTNLHHRTLNIVYKNFKTKISTNKKYINQEIMVKITETKKEIEHLHDKVNLSVILKTILKLSNFANKYIDENRPWNLIKNQEIEKAKYILIDIINIIKSISIMIEPIIPNISKKILKTINTSNEWKEIENFKNEFKIEKSEIFVKKIFDFF